MKTHLRKLWDSLRSSYWFLPLIMMLLTLLLWAGTRSLDQQLSRVQKQAFTWLFISDADSIRTLLLTIAAAIIGLIGVVFTIVMVPLTIAAAQFGPRLLRTFLRDTGTQLTLGIFNSTFVFCMAVLLQLSQADQHKLPQISVNVALLLGFASFIVLLYFVNHVSTSLQAPVVVQRVSKELHAAIRHDLPDDIADSKEQTATTQPFINTPNTAVVANHSGYVQVRDDAALLQLAQQHNLVLQLLVEPGDFVVAGTPLIQVWPANPSGNINKVVNTAYVLGVQRTLVQDVTFGINELVEVALRALSPAINDPFTAITCLDWIGSALCQTCSRKFPEPYLFDKQNQLRIIRNPVTFTKLADAAFSQIREYGRSSLAVTLRQMHTFRVIGQCTTTPEQRSALLHHAARTDSGCHTGLTEKSDQQLIKAEYDLLRQVLA